MKPWALARVGPYCLSEKLHEAICPGMDVSILVWQCLVKLEEAVGSGMDGSILV